MTPLRSACAALTFLSVANGCAWAQPAREDLLVYAAGSLRAAKSDLARGFEGRTATPVKLTLGASGLLKDRIQAGEKAQVFASANMEHPQALRAAGVGSAAALKAKVLQPTGGANSPPPPARRNVYGVLVSEGQADFFITYCTSATEAKQQQPSLQVLALPESANVAAVYGIAAMQPADPTARAFVDYVTGPEGQQILGRYGFSTP